MADDALVLQQPIDVPRRKAADPLDVEPVKRLTEMLTLPQDRQPAQTRLKSLEADLLEQSRVIADRPPPFAIVVLDVERIGAAPPASLLRGQ